MKPPWVFYLSNYIVDLTINCFHTLFVEDRPYKQLIPLTLANGQHVYLPVLKKEKVFKTPESDGIQDYGKLVLDLGLLYMTFLDQCKVPNQGQMLSTLKMMLVIFKANNNLSKYAYEVLRFLMQQLTLCTQQQAHDVFHSMFVNTHGRINSHIPSDMKMETIVSEQKKHIKHMYSNKLDDEVIRKKSQAIHGINRIAEGFDTATSVVVRATAHKTISSLGDERAMVQDLRKVRPFHLHPGRSFERMPLAPPSLSKTLNAMKFNKWVMEKKATFTLEHNC